MSNFKRNSSSFQRGAGAPASGDSSKPASYPSRNQRDAGESRGAPRGNTNGGNSGGGDFKFTKLGSITVAKSVDDATYQDVMEGLRGNDKIKLTTKVYLPKGVEEIAIRTGDLLLIDFRVTEKDKEFVIGKLSIANG